jgi:hypothetical protein
LFTLFCFSDALACWVLLQQQQLPQRELFFANRIRLKHTNDLAAVKQKRRSATSTSPSSTLSVWLINVAATGDGGVIQSEGIVRGGQPHKHSIATRNRKKKTTTALFEYKTQTTVFSIILSLSSYFIIHFSTRPPFSNFLLCQKKPKLAH